MTYRIAFLGPPGSGKGTQADLLAPVLGVPIIGPGAAYRREIAAGTALGKEVSTIVESGVMVPNATTNAIMSSRLAASDCAEGFILDGYPRELEQLEALDAAAPPLTHAILLTIDEAEVLRRLAERLVCVCGKQYNRRELAIDVGDEARCAACNGTLTRRKDDDPDRIRTRIAIYRERTEPVVAFYRNRGILVEVNGQQSVDAVHAEILSRIGVDSR